MKRFSFGKSKYLLAVLALLTCGAITANARSPHRPPSRVNTESIRTTSNGSFMQLFRPQSGRAAYNGGILNFHSNRSGAVAPAQYTAAQDVDMDLLPSLPSPTGEPEEVQGILQSQQEPVLVDGSMIPEGLPSDGYGCASCGPAKGKGKGQGVFDDWNWFCLCVPLPPDDNLTFNLGVHGFKNALSGGLDNSFGVQEGFNLGFAVPWCTLGLGWQIGLQGVHSNFSGAGSPLTVPLATDDERNQLFLTWGFYRRVDCGLQWGIAFDYLHDDWHYDVSISQMRGEFSWMHSCYHEFGLFFHAGMDDDHAQTQLTLPTVQSNTFNVQSTDLYALFYRHNFDDCGYSFCRTYIGVTGDRDRIGGTSEGSSALFGLDLHVGMSEKWAVESSFTAVAASSGHTNNAQEEDWNVGINLIWYPHGMRTNECRRYYRPLFNVADNGSFLVNVSN